MTQRKKKGAKKRTFKRDNRQGEKQRHKRQADELAPTETMAPPPTAKSKGKGALRKGNPGNKGNKMGRPRNELRQFMRDIVGLTQDEIMSRLTKKVTRKDARGRSVKVRLADEMTVTELRMIMETASKYGLGQPMHVKMTGSGENGEMQVAVVGPRPSSKAVAKVVTEAAATAAAAAVGVVKPKS